MGDAGPGGSRPRLGSLTGRGWTGSASLSFLCGGP